MAWPAFRVAVCAKKHSFSVELIPWRNFRVALAGYPGGETRFRGALMLDVGRSLPVIKRGSGKLLIEAELIERLKSGRRGAFSSRGVA